MWFQGAYLCVPFLLSCFATRDEKNLPKGDWLSKGIVDLKIAGESSS